MGKDYSIKRIIKERPVLSCFVGLFLLCVMPYWMWVLSFHVAMFVGIFWLVDKLMKIKPVPVGCPHVRVEEIVVDEAFLLKQSIIVTGNEVRVYARELAKWNKDAADVLKGLTESLGRLYSFLDANPDRYLEVFDVYKDAQIVINNLKPVVATYHNVSGYIGTAGLDEVTEKMKEIVGSKVDLISRRIDVLFGAETAAVVKAIEEMGTALDALGTGTDSTTRN